MQLTVNGREFVVASEADWQRCRDSARAHPFAEVWLDAGEGGRCSACS